MEIAIIIPVYNRDYCLKRAVDSVLQQTYDNFKIYIVDDASTDNSLALAHELKESNPEKIQLVSLPHNRGVSFARNSILMSVRADAYAFLDSDDEWISTKLAAQVKVLAETEIMLVHTEEIWIRNGVRVNPAKKHQKKGGFILEDCLDMCRISPSSVLIRREVFEEIGYFREDFPVCEDFDLWLRICSVYPVAFIEEAQIIKYGGHADQLSRKFHSMDYYRVKSLVSLLHNRSLDSELVLKIKNIIKAKAEILIQGYKKHNNLENLEEIEGVLNEI